MPQLHELVTARQTALPTTHWPHGNTLRAIQHGMAKEAQAENHMTETLSKDLAGLVERCGAFMTLVNGVDGMYCNAAKGHLGAHRYTFDSFVSQHAVAEPQVTEEAQRLATKLLAAPPPQWQYAEIQDLAKRVLAAPVAPQKLTHKLVRDAVMSVWPDKLAYPGDLFFVQLRLALITLFAGREQSIKVNGMTKEEMFQRLETLETPPLAPPPQVLQNAIEFHKAGQIPVNAPTCDKCGKLFLDCICKHAPGEQPQVAHNVNPETDRCVRCGKNRFKREQYPNCMTTGDYVTKWQAEKAERAAPPVQERERDEAICRDCGANYHHTAGQCIDNLKAALATAAKQAREGDVRWLLYVGGVDHETLLDILKGDTSAADGDVDVDVEFADLQRALATQPAQQPAKGERWER